MALIIAAAVKSRSATRALTGDEQAVLAGLSVFRGGFTAEAARDIVNAFLPSLAGLIDRSLLNLQETPQGGRYFLHELK
jgi:hypothetical protein